MERTTMRGSTQSLITAGIAVGLGAALIWKLTHRRRVRVPASVPEDHWSPAARLLTGAIGGGLVLYSSRAPGRFSRIAMTAGAGLLMRSLQDQPVRKLTDVVQPRALLGA